MKTLYTTYLKITHLSFFCWLICSMNGLHAQSEADTIPRTPSFPVQAAEPVGDQNPGEEIAAGLLLDEQNDSLQIEPVIETQITAEGDTLYLYSYDAFDFGDVYTGRPDTTVAGTTVSRLGNHAATARVGTMSSGNGEVGNISFSEGITPSGGRTYSIPVATAPVASSAPQVAIVYNSQGGNGVAGYGWNVAGTSAITVGGKNHYYDNSVSPVDLTNALSNALFIDGTRLVTNAGSPTEYQYESAQGFVLVKRNMYNSNTIAYFTVLYPNGSEATFGFTNNTQNRLVYPLTSIRDIKGYRIDFEYIISGNNYHVSAIKYGSKSQSSHPGLISFTYTARTDVTPVYNGGTELKQDRLLTKIVTSNNGSELRTYSLSHTLKDGANLLTQLGCSVGASSLNPLTFEYGNAYDQGEGYLVNDATQFLAQYFPQSAKPIHYRGKFIKNKFNDGLIALPGAFSTYGMTKEKVKKFLGIVVGGPWYEFGSLYPANQTILIAPGLSFYSPTQTITAEAGFQTITAADVNGDGTDEIIKINFNGIVSGKTRLKITVYSVSASGTLSSSVKNVLVQGIVQDNDFTSPISRDYYFGDFKGDGKVQLLTVSHNKTFKNEARTSYFALIDLSSGSLLSENSLFSYASSDERYLHTIDINGDGKTELCYATSSGYEVYALQANNAFSKQATYTGIYRSTFSSEVFWGDINGDGKPDILKGPPNSYYEWVYPEPCPPGVICDDLPIRVPDEREIEPRPPLTPEPYQRYVDKGKTWTIYYSTGTRFSSKSMNIVNKHAGEQYLLMDMDRDGNADLLQVKNNRVYVYANEKGLIGNTSPNSLPVAANSKIMGANVVDYNGMSHFICVQDGYVRCYSYSKDRGKNRLLTMLADSYGLQYYNEYDDMTSPYGNYINGSITRYYPYAPLIAPLNLLRSSYIYKDSYTALKQYYYTWYGAVAHKTGLGFGSFEKVRTIEYVENITTEEERNPELFGVTTKIDSPFSTAYYYYTRNEGSYRKCNPRMTSSNETDKLTGVYTYASYQYDAYNNPTKVTQNIGSGTVTRVTDQTYDNIVTPARYLTGQPLVKTVTTTRGGASWTDKETITYNTDRLPATRITYTGTGGSNKTGETRWTYDTNGNVTSEKSASYNVTEFLGNTYTYDSSGRYLASVTNALSQITTYSNYDKYGNPKTITDHKNRITTRNFDAWGRLTSAAYPDGTTETSTIDWGGAGLYTVTATATGSPDAVTHYDALGREIRGGNLRFDGQWQYVDQAYDNKGRIEKVSLPFKGPSPTAWNTYTYDNYNRPTKLEEASGKASTWSYHGLSVTETKNGIATTKTTDASGALVSVTDPGGTITYTLRPDGQPSSITAPGNVVTSFGYDSYGRQTSIADPSAGTQTFNDVYASNGELTRTVKDANNKTVTSTHDKYGRVTGVSRPEFNTAYAYNADGLLVSEISTNGTEVHYEEYDAFDRIKVVKETVPDGKWLKKTFNYNSGNIQNILHVSQNGEIGTEHFIYNYGHNTEIKLGTASIWKLTEENALGQPTKATTGSMNRTYSYTAYGMPAGRAAGSIQSFTYDFDVVKGNLNSRKDNSRNITETFGYDYLNRLTNAAGKAIAYSANGNITSIAGVGTLAYENSGKPYQISMLTPEGDAVPVREQEVTYTSFQRPSTLAENGYNTTFTYNAAGDRVKMLFKQGSTDVLTRYYIGGQYEIDKEGSVERLYLGGDAYSAPAVYVKEGSNWNIYYICRDYLGSITHVANADGSLAYEYSYDAWGRLRNPTTQVAHTPGSEPALFLGRGYTGHEHLPWFGLINMNARLYDAALGRFLSPDPYVQMPDFSQNFNRYSYCVNNPLIYIDPSGEWFLIDDLIGALVGGIINWVGNGCQFNKQGLTYFGVGLVGGWASLYISPAGGGALMGGMNSVVHQGFGEDGDWNWRGISIEGVLFDTAIGGVTAGVGSKISGAVTPHISKLTSKLGGKAIQEMTTQGLGGSFTGFTISTGASLLDGDDLETALGKGWGGAKSGWVAGSIGGLGSGLRQAYKAGENPWTGKIRTEVTSGDLNLSTTVERINKGEAHPHRNDGTVFRNEKNILPQKPQGYYKEYVHPTSGINHAGLQRIVVGNGGEWYYTPDHYKTFIRFKP